MKQTFHPVGLQCKGSNTGKICIRKIVVNDRSEVGTFFRHGSRATLAKSHAVPLTETFENYFVPAFVRRKSVARHRVPSEAPTYR